MTLYGLINLHEIYTNPGARSAFAPPLGFEGDYRDFLVQRMKVDIGVHQHVGMVARKINQGIAVEFFGEYAEVARRITERVSAKLLAASQAEKARRGSPTDS